MILWLNPTAGLSGDMLLGALLDLGAPLDAVRAAIASTGVQGWSVEPICVQRQGIRSLHAQVAVTDSTSERSAADLVDLVSGAQPEPVGAVARAAVLSLAKVEAGIHGVSIDEVHLHELGGIDTVVDTVSMPPSSCRCTSSIERPWMPASTSARESTAALATAPTGSGCAPETSSISSAAERSLAESVTAT